jgi:hypothetical protein
VLKRKTGKPGLGYLSDLAYVCSGRRWLLHTGPRITILQPQMKKYRSLWCMSTTNHKILYFPHIRGIFLLNSGLRLWKAGNPLVR